MRLTLGLIACLLSSSLALATIAEATWDNLGHVTKKRSYTFLLRDGSCMEGQLITADPESVTIERSGAGGNVTLKRLEVVRVFDGSGAGDMIFNGRNSWSDIGKIHPLKGERIRALLKDGTEYKGEATVTDSDITIEGHKVPKARVLRVFYDRTKPHKKDGEHAAAKKLSRSIPALLYDATVPENDLPAACKAH